MDGLAARGPDADPYRVLAEHGTDVAYTTEPTGAVTWISAAVTRVLGWRPEQIRGTVLRSLVHPDDAQLAEHWRARLLAPAASGRPPGGTSEPVRLRCEDGTYLWCSVTVAPVRDDRGGIAAVAGIVHVVDDLVRARIDAADAHTRLHAVLDAFLDPHVTLTAIRDDAGAVCDFVIDDANGPAASYYATTPQQMIGCTVTELMGPDAGQVDIDRAASVLRDGSALVLNDDPSRLRRSQGQAAAWLDVRIAPVDADRVIYTWRDVTERHDAREEIALAHDLLRAVIDGHVDPHVIVCPVRGTDGEIVDFRYEDANEAAAAFEGRERRVLLGATFREIYRDEREALEDIADCARALETGQLLSRNDSRTLGYVDALGRPEIVDIRIIPLAADRVLYTWRDVTDRHFDQQRLARSEERFRLLAENMSDVVLLMQDGLITWVSPSAERVVGANPEQFIGRDPIEFAHPDDVARIREAALGAGADAPPRIRCRVRAVDGGYHWVDVEANMIAGAEAPAMVLSARIVDTEVAALQALQQQARHDELTGLVNRHAVFEHLARVLEGEVRSGTRLAMVFVDLDGFKAVNDDHGHGAGDELLRQLGARLQSQVRSGDLVARIGGDEFLVVLDGVQDLDNAVEIAEKLRQQVTEPATVLGATVSVGASVGVTLAERGENVDSIVARADDAMYLAKRRGKGAVVAIPSATPDR